MAAELPWERPDPFVIDVVVEPRHIDALGHVNNVHYLSWLQRCAWAHSTARGFSEEQMLRLDRAMVVRETHMPLSCRHVRGRPPVRWRLDHRQRRAFARNTQLSDFSTAG